MRNQKLIKKGNPCSINYEEKEIQSAMDPKNRVCPNIEECSKRSESESIHCYRRLAQQMARFIFGNINSFESAVQEERQRFLETYPNNVKFWVCRDEKWQIIKGKENVIDDIVAFARVIIDLKPGERRPFTQDGKILEIFPEDATHNAELDLVDIVSEVKPFGKMRS